MQIEFFFQERGRHLLLYFAPSWVKSLCEELISKGAGAISLADFPFQR